MGRGAARASGGDHLRSLLQAPRRGGQWRPHDQPGWRPPPAQGLSQSPVPPDAQAWWVHSAPCRSKPARPATGRAGQAVSKSSGSPSWRPKEVAAMATSTLCRSREVRRFPAAPQPPGGGLNSGPRPSSVWHGEPLGSAGAPPHAAVPPPPAAPAGHLTLGLQSRGLRLKLCPLLVPGPGGRQPAMGGTLGAVPRRQISPGSLGLPGGGGQAGGTQMPAGGRQIARCGFVWPGGFEGRPASGGALSSSRPAGDGIAKIKGQEGPTWGAWPAPRRVGVSP